MNIEPFLSLHHSFKTSGIPEAIHFEQMNEILISHHSTAIEGSSLTEDETRLLLTEGITAKGKPLQDHNMVHDHHQALLHTIRAAGRKEPLSVAMIQQLSAMVMKSTGGIVHAAAGTCDSSQGDFRKSMVYVGTRYFIHYQKVPGEVEKLIRQINEQMGQVQTPEEIYSLAFDAHFKLVGIHPFIDGNGRVSRLLMNYILTCHRQPLAIIFNRDRADYFQALELSRENDSLQPFREFMFEQQIKYFRQELNKLNQIL